MAYTRSRYIACPNHAASRNLCAMDTYYVYILASRHHRHLSVDVTANLSIGVRERRELTNRRLHKRRVLQKLVYVEAVQGMEEAIDRRQQLHRLPRRDIARVVESVNPAWDSISIGELAKSGFTSVI